MQIYTPAPERSTVLDTEKIDGAFAFIICPSISDVRESRAHNRNADAEIG